MAYFWASSVDILPLLEDSAVFFAFLLSCYSLNYFYLKISFSLSSNYCFNLPFSSLSSFSSFSTSVLCFYKNISISDDIFIYFSKSALAYINCYYKSFIYLSFDCTSTIYLFVFYMMTLLLLSFWLILRSYSSTLLLSFL